MLIPLPLGLEPPSPGPRVWPWASTVLIVVISVMFLSERTLAAALTRHQLPAGIVGEHMLRLLADVGSAGRLYADPALFAPWQLWSWPLFHAGWWQAGAGVLALLMIAPAVERELSALAFIAVLLVLTPLIGLGALLTHVGGPLPDLGASALAVALLALAFAARPRAQLAFGVGYYALVQFGWRRIAALPLPGVAALVIAQDGLRALLAHQSWPAPAFAVALGAGMAAGFLASATRPSPR